MARMKTLAEAYARLEDLTAAPWGRHFWGDPVHLPGRPVPSPEAFARCRTLLSILGDLRRVPYDVLPHGEAPGGVGAIFSHLTGAIVCLNDGTTLGLRYLVLPTRFEQWDLSLTLEGVRAALEKIDEATPAWAAARR
jgi:hypothetical protein